ncbi:hypothetical protein HDU97_009206 [Phlyctochytrium planicorne]|nr:hypothetical protein HDU97_009206 [Phlyctochytrium planicorne]
MIPMRTDDTVARYNTLPVGGSKRKQSDDIESFRDSNSQVYDAVVRNEVVGIPLDPFMSSPVRSNPPKIFQFSTPHKRKYNSPSYDRLSSTPLSLASQAILNTPIKTPRNIPKAPFKVLDAPDLQDDFYLNLVDWSSKNILGVGLGSCVYTWNASTSQVEKLCDLGQDDSVTSVSWNQRGSELAIGTNKGLIEIWDLGRRKRIQKIAGHESRVGSLAWHGSSLTSGSRDKNILDRDLRSPSSVRTLSYHRQEVCGLKWNSDGNYLASGGNDNKLLIWDRSQSGTPLYAFSDHIAAVKAIAWSPHQSTLLASGGGTADRKIRFWNTQHGLPLSSHDTSSQVCNLAWSQNADEIVSTHGYSQNHVSVWKVKNSQDRKNPRLESLATLTGHTLRVLYLATSPDGQSVVTGAGDETLRFWNVFPKARPKESREIMSDGLTLETLR